MSRRSCGARVLVAATAGLGGCSSAAPPGDSGPSDRLALAFVPIALETAPSAITEMKFIPGTLDMLVLSKNGTVTHYRLDGDSARADRLGSFQVPGVDESSDCGLISMAFDPDYGTNHWVYFAACDSPEFSRITRHVLALPDYDAVATTTAEVIRVGTMDAPKAWHNVGSIGFDGTGAMWALFGDKNVDATGQTLSDRLGAVIRIVPDPGPGGGYRPAPDNPFAGAADASADIAAYGLRSPWRGALDDAGRLWFGDVGNSAFEEINVSRFDGENYGWSLAEGPCRDECDDQREPLAWWDRSSEHLYAREDPHAVPTSRRAAWVGTSYPRAVAIDRYDGRFFDRMLVGDFCTGWIRGIGLDAQDQVIYDHAAGHLVGATSWTVGVDGYVYVSTYGSCLASPYVTGSVLRAVLADE